MAKIRNEKKTAYLDLFHVREPRLGGPQYEGRLKTENGEEYVKVWVKKRETCTGGEFLSGYSYTVSYTEDNSSTEGEIPAHNNTDTKNPF